MNRFALICLIPPLLALTACGEPEDTRPGKPVATRQAAFKQIIRRFEPMGVMLRDKVYEPKGFAAQASKLNEIKDAPWAHFGPETQYPPSKSTDAVWQQPEDFAKARDVFLKSVSTLAQVAQSEKEEAVRKAYDDVHASCKSCHKVFRNR